MAQTTTQQGLNFLIVLPPSTSAQSSQRLCFRTSDIAWEPTTLVPLSPLPSTADVLAMQKERESSGRGRGEG